jgi:carbonic anhydrase/acetyltransferase-like protein (isoleucine patch superfamily)
MLRALGAAVGPHLVRLGQALEVGGVAVKAAAGVPFEQPLVKAVGGAWPALHEGAVEAQLHLQDAAGKEVVPSGKFVAPSACVAPEASIAQGGSVWYNATVSGSVSLGEGSAVLEHAVVVGEARRPTVLGASVVVGPRARVGAGARLGDRAVVSAGAVLGNGVTLGADAVVAQGAQVGNGATVGARELWAGVPAAKVRTIDAAELASYADKAAELAQLATVHAVEAGKDFRTVYLERRAFEDRGIWAEDVLEDDKSWATYANIDMNPNKEPHRRGLIYDKDN